MEQLSNRSRIAYDNKNNFKYLSQSFMEVKVLLTLRKINFYLLQNPRESGDLDIYLPYWQTPCTHFPLLNVPVVQESPNAGQIVLSVSSVM